MKKRYDITRTTRVTTHPGEMLFEEYLKPIGLSATAFAAEIGVPTNRITMLIKGQRAMTADTHPFA